MATFGVNVWYLEMLFTTYALGVNVESFDHGSLEYFFVPLSLLLIGVRAPVTLRFFSDTAGNTKLKNT